MLSTVLSSISRLLWKTSSTSLVQLPSGELYMEKTINGKTRKDCLMQNSEMTIAKTPDHQQSSFHYNLVVEQTLDDPDPEHDSTSISFDICDSLNFIRVTSESGGISFQWKGPMWTPKPNPKAPIVIYEWIPDKSISAHTLQLFHYTIAQCLYERAYGLPYTQASDQEIEDILQGKFPSSPSNPPINAKDDHFSGTLLYSSSPVPFFIFDPQSGHFIPQYDHAIAKIIAHKDYSFSLLIYSDDSIAHQQFINPSAVQHVDRPTHSFVWCLSEKNLSVTTFSLKFSDESSLFTFANIYARCVYEILNHESMNDLPKADNDYLVNPFIQDVDMTDIDSSEDELPAPSKASSTVFQSSKEGEKNRQLVIGYQYDRSFVSRGSSIGVFKNKSDDGIEFVTNIKGVETKEHKKFSPSKMILYDEDSSLLLMNPNDQQTIYRMDLEVGKVVDEWKADEYTNITNIIPDTKYAAMTPNKTFIGINKNSVFRMDPRLSGSKKVESESKQYVVKNDFTCGATTGSGELAVASKKGDIRLFNKLDKRAKTLLPGFGDPIIGIDVTESGKYILATCKTYLLLICTEIEDGVTGFTKSMGSDNKPLPKRLALKPEHVAYMGEEVQFTEAHFSTGPSEERAIIASTGPYVITWTLKSILKDRLYDYQIKKYSDIIVADNFKYGQDSNIIVTLPDQVTMIDKSVLQSPKSKKSFHSIVDSPF